MSLLAKLLAERGEPARDLCSGCGGVFKLTELLYREARPGVRFCEPCALNDPVEVIDAIENPDNRPYIPPGQRQPPPPQESS